MKYLITVLFILAALSLGAQTLVLDVPHFPPLSVIKGNNISGSFYDLTVKIMQNAGITVNYKATSTYAAALNDLKTGKCDGFFPAIQNAERDEVAVRTKQVMTQDWVWVKLKATDLSPSASDFKSKAKVGTLLETAQETFLKNNGYTITGNPANLDSLVSMLVANRFNVILTNEHTWDIAVKESGKDPNMFTKFVERTTNVGIYISKTTLAKYPELINKLNASIDKVDK
jgi:polar amino acid transport system substrate-binding protein